MEVLHPDASFQALAVQPSDCAPFPGIPPISLHSHLAQVTFYTRVPLWHTWACSEPWTVSCSHVTVNTHLSPQWAPCNGLCVKGQRWHGNPAFKIALDKAHFLFFVSVNSLLENREKNTRLQDWRHMGTNGWSLLSRKISMLTSHKTNYYKSLTVKINKCLHDTVSVITKA